MQSTSYDPPASGGQPPQQYPGYPPYPQYPYYQYPGYPQQYPPQGPPPGPKKEDRTVLWLVVVLVVIFVVIPIIIAGVLYVWVSSSSSSSYEDGSIVNLVATLDQGDGNMDSGCLFVIQKGSGDSVRIENYRFKVSKEGYNPVTLRWPQDGNMTFSIDSGLKSNDDEWWDATERVGFDAPPGLTGVYDGDRVEVDIINLQSGDVVYSSSFTYRD